MRLGLPASRLLSIHPVMFFFSVVALLWMGTMVGSFLRRRRVQTLAEETSTFKTLESAVLALLGLLLGFTFSMGVSRYDQRKTLEISEANLIRNVWLRTDTLPQPEKALAESLLKQYVPERLAFLDAGTSQERIDSALSHAVVLQRRIWLTASQAALANPDPVSAQLLASVADMVNITESRTAAFENRIPVLAWVMLLFISFIASMLVGIGISSRSQLL